MPKVEFLRKNRFVEIQGATAEQVASNAWELAIPRDAEGFRTPLKPEAFDDAVFAIDEVETVFAIGSGTRKDAVLVSVILP
jgi:hypothetical protein